MLQSLRYQIINNTDSSLVYLVKFMSVTHKRTWNKQFGNWHAICRIVTWLSCKLSLLKSTVAAFGFLITCWVIFKVSSALVLLLWLVFCFHYLSEFDLNCLFLLVSRWRSCVGLTLVVCEVRLDVTFRCYLFCLFEWLVPLF